MDTNISSSTAQSSNVFIVNGEGNLITESVKAKVSRPRGMPPHIYFQYVKRKLNIIEKLKLDTRKRKLEKAFETAVENGQEALAEKFLRVLALDIKETLIYAKGVTNYIKKSDLEKYKHKIRDGHISDTPFNEYTRIIPKDVLKKKKELEGVFDDFVIYHYWSKGDTVDVDDKMEMTEQEKEDMRDPILFGILEDSNRLYFIADWDDEYCDLSFAEIIEVVAANTLKIGELRIKDKKQNGK